MSAFAAAEKKKRKETKNKKGEIEEGGCWEIIKMSLGLHAEGFWFLKAKNHTRKRRKNILNFRSSFL